MRMSDWSSDVCSSDLLPFPLLVDELLARVIGALVLLERHLAFDHHLRRDAGVIGADNPQRVLALEPRVADEDILQGVVERMADMKAARHVGRRVDDRPRLGARPRGMEQAAFRSDEHTSELKSLMRTANAVLCLQKKTTSCQ